MGKALVPSLRDSLGLSRPTPGTSVPGFRMPPPFDFAQGRLSGLEPGNGSFGARFRDSASRTTITKPAGNRRSMYDFVALELVVEC
jgi:hypothetical protein